MTIEQLNALLPEPINGMKMSWEVGDISSMLFVGEYFVVAFQEYMNGYTVTDFIGYDDKVYDTEEEAARQCVEYAKKFIQKLFA